MHEASELLGVRRFSGSPILGFPRHWQQIEAGRPITLTTLLRICDALDARLTTILLGQDRELRD